LNPKISWQVKETDDTFTLCKTYDDISYVPGEYITKTIRVWNNYYGTEDVANAKDCTLVVAFKNFEDSFLLRLTEVSIDEGEFKPLELDIDKGVISIGSLSGSANSGTDMNRSNFKDIELKIGPIPDNIKSELKSIYFYLEYLSEEIR
jgi:hypothetical protein